MALRKTMESWTSSLRPNKPSKLHVAPLKAIPSFSQRKRSIGKTNLHGVSAVSPKKTRLEARKVSVQKPTRLQTFVSGRIKTVKTVLNEKLLPPTCDVKKTFSRRLTTERLDGKEALTPTNYPENQEKASLMLTNDEICERLQILELQVQRNSQLAEERVKQLLEENEGLVKGLEHFQSLSEKRTEQLRRMESVFAETSKKLFDTHTDFEKLKTDFASKSAAFEESKEKLKTLEIEHSIAKKLVSLRDSESRTLRTLLDNEQNKTRIFDEKLASVASEKELVQRRLRKSQSRLSIMQNELLETDKNVKVFVRIRPMPGDDNGSCPLRTQRCSIIIEKPCQKAKSVLIPFDFDRVLDANISQCEVFEEVEPFIVSALNGCNVCILAYGQTGTGKTFTIEGPSRSVKCGTVYENRGIVHRAFEKIFELATEEQETKWVFSFTASFMEIYNDTVYDLLDKNQSGNVRLSFTPKRVSNAVENFQAVPIRSRGQISKLIETAQSRRSVTTKCNNLPSRSHCIFQLHIKAKNSSTGAEKNSVLTLVDVAGFERGKETFGEVSLAETTSPNFCLTQLLSVYSKASGNPHRNSKLTRLLSSALADNSKTLIMAHVSPAEKHLDETVNSLEIARKFRQLNMENTSKH